jgi:hypothetical protein
MIEIIIHGDRDGHAGIQTVNTWILSAKHPLTPQR